MSTELHTQIHAYGTQLTDDQAPITEPEVLALVASVRELPVVEQPARAKRRPSIAVAAAAVTLVVGGLLVWLATQSDPDAKPADTTIVGLLALDDLDDAVLRPLDQIRLGDIIVPTAPTDWALDPEVYIDPDQPAFVVTVWNHDASRAYEIWAAPACGPTATRCPVFSYGSIPWPLTDPAAFSEVSDVVGDSRRSHLAAVIGEYAVVVAPDRYSPDGILGLPSIGELITSLRAVAPDELPLQVTPAARDMSPVPAAVEAALALFQPLDEVHVMTPGSGGPLPQFPSNIADFDIVESRHVLALHNPHGYLDVWTFMPPAGFGPQCVGVRGSLGNVGEVGPPVDDTWCEGVELDAYPELYGAQYPFFYDVSLGDVVLILLKGGPDTIAFIVEEQDGRRVGLVAVSGLAFYLNGERNGCEEIPSELTAIEADGTTHTVSPWQLTNQRPRC